MLMPLTGCANFFVSETGSSGSSGSTTSSGDYAYVSNSVSGSTYINGYSLAAGTLAATTGSPYSLGFVPQAMTVTPNNTFLYIASTVTTAIGAIYVYSIGTGGQLSILNGGSAAATANVSSLAVSPDGNWLFALDTTGSLLQEYSISSSSGYLTLLGSINIPTPTVGVVTPQSVKVGASGDFVVCALGTAGDEIFAFDTATGALNTNPSLIGTGVTTFGDYALASDSGNFLFVARTGGVVVYSLTTAGVPTAVNGSPFTAGAGTHSLTLDQSGDFLYAANQTDGTISEFSVGTVGALSNVSGTPVAAPPAVASIGSENSGKYVLALGYDATAGVKLYTIGSTGALTLSGSAASGTVTTIPAVLALTH